ncbi:ABC transporter ATP-binding protein [Rhizobium laguerreae]|uniref:ABC transporter ATP-binding protein n=1 Tax=Rhizobium laguerreae TaxID=1076926 RepID=UPI00144232C2|nr:ABC transporter ATP-binding protein [Rhizobium laguerreae]MBN9982765.1 ABC transporter ATP-binding protein [Rhizobium laguerreae]MBY3216566.1 ABC transporter ATP-binding protein [Rhizobium laguerreae]MBY3326494.1 ABC transporter ATP-binding protein [Rhizobium laguerreae]MBY3417437.1 ABC transporter ATP-binding protein [Rhizobium laguerreae]NKM34061.1 ATP-binding cassette domain-containing protein [Rhizobium laguerreae]
MALLEVEDLQVSFDTAAGRILALNGVSFSLERGEVLALLGESGSGKSVTASAIMDLVPNPPGEINRGSIRFDGVELLQLSRNERRDLCGDRIALIFQDALAALNPVYSVGWQIAEMFRIHGRTPEGGVEKAVIDLLTAIGIPDPESRAKQYPHEFSGGMRQRIMIAMAVALEPDVIIADEPTTALDVTIQAQVVDLLETIRKRSDAGMIFITHDLGVVAELADRVAVMYAGRVVETASVFELFEDARHPYSVGLLSSQPRMDTDEDELVPIPGSAPNPVALPSGCAFRTRCPRAEGLCAEIVPSLEIVGPGRQAACHFPVSPV